VQEVMLDLVEDVNIMLNKSWESVYKSRLVYFRIMRLVKKHSKKHLFNKLKQIEVGI
jgi:hypothetical protein